MAVAFTPFEAELVVPSVGRFWSLDTDDPAEIARLSDAAAAERVAACESSFRRQAMDDITRWLRESARLHRIAGTFPLAETAAAHEAVEAGTKRGTVVVLPLPDDLEEEVGIVSTRVAQLGRAQYVLSYLNVLPTYFFLNDCTVESC